MEKIEENGEKGKKSKKIEKNRRKWKKGSQMDFKEAPSQLPQSHSY